MEQELSEEFKAQAIFRIRESLERIGICLAELSDAEIWARPNAASNTIGNLILHLNGNISQWILTGLADHRDDRDRDAEFSAEGGIAGKALLERLSETLARAIAVIGDAGPEGLLRKRWVQGFEFSGMGIILHVVEHLSYHTGQVAFRTKALKQADLGFYRDVDLNQRSG